MFRILSRALLVLSVSFLASGAGAQTQSVGGIRGRVLDQTNAAMPGVSVTVTNTQTGATRSTTTDRSGFYGFPSLPLTGQYKVVFAIQGFATKEIDGIALRAGETATVDATLLASGGTSEVTVYGTTQNVRADEPQLGVRLDQQKIEQTPILGRKMTNLPLLDSAVRPAINTGDLFLNNMLFVVNGSGRRQTTFSLDGSSADDAWGRQTVFTNVPLSAIQEFTVLSNAFSAEYGRTTGAAVNIVTKSGTNTTHGDALYAFRPSGLEADNPVTNSPTPDVLNQFSGSIGGPLVMDRTHYFVAAEYNHQTRDSVITSPLGPAGTNYTGTYNQGLLDARVDHSLSNAQQLTFKANVDGFSDDNPQGAVGGQVLPSAGRTFNRKAYGAQAGWNAVLSSSMLNDARFQVFYGSPITNFQPNEPGTQYVYPGYATIGESRVADLYNHQFELSDTLTMTRGRHSLRVGADLTHSTSGGNGQEFGSGFLQGQFTVKSGVTTPVSQLTVDDIQRFQQAFGTSSYVEKEWLWSVFAQDDIKLRSDFTLNAGLRYERQTFTDDTNNVAPRVGFTYNVGGDPKTVLRGGYGIYYSEVRTDAAAGWELGGPTGVFSFGVAPGQFGFPASLTALPAFPPGATLPARDVTIRPGMASYYSQFFDVSKLKGYPDRLLNPWTQSGTIGVERELAGGWFASADYVTQHTELIDRPLDLNSPAPFVRTAAGQTRSAAAADATRPIVPTTNGYRRIIVYVNDGIADYDGLQLNVRKTSDRYSLLASYTLSKATNTVEPDVPGQDPNDANFTGEEERAPSLLDQRHRFVLSGSLRLPYDFAAGGVVTMGSGLPYNITTGTDNNGDGSNSDRPIVNGQLATRNSGKGTPIYDTSIFVERAFALAPSRRVNLRMEIFNLFDHANIVGRNGTYGNAASGVPSATLGTPNGGVNSVFPGRQVTFMARVAF
jgi:hypothetical protein